MRTTLALLLGVFLLIPSHSPASESPLSLTDLLAWKHIPTPIVSNDGQWFAYKLVPNDGNSELVLTHLPDGKEQRFPIGEVVRPNPYTSGPEAMAALAGKPHDLAFSDDSKWLAFSVHPTEKELASLRKTHKPAEDKAVLVELITQKKTEFDRIKRFGFSGERSSALALHRYGAAPAPADAPAKPDDKPQGSDLIVMDLATRNELSLGNVSDFAFNKKGDWLAWVVDAQDKLGNGVELRNMINGSVAALDSADAIYKSLTWTEKGDGLAVLRGADDKHWTDKALFARSLQELQRDRLA